MRVNDFFRFFVFFDGSKIVSKTLPVDGNISHNRGFLSSPGVHGFDDDDRIFPLRQAKLINAAAIVVRLRVKPTDSTTGGTVRSAAKRNESTQNIFFFLNTTAR